MTTTSTAELRPVVRARGSAAMFGALALLYSTLSTWSVGAGFGRYDADGGWTDPTGDPTAVAPVEVRVTSHPMVWVLVLVAGLLIAGVVAARRAPTVDDARRRLAISTATSIVLVLGVLLVCSGLQAWLVEEAIAAQRVPVVFGGAVLEVTRMPPG